jgi:hypothetical protein
MAILRENRQEESYSGYLDCKQNNPIAGNNWTFSNDLAVVRSFALDVCS